MASTRVNARADRLDRVHELQPSLPDRGDPIGHVLHLGEHVRGEEHRAAVVHPFAQERVEGLLHQRVEPGRRLVEDEQLGPVEEGEDDPDLLAVALRERPYRTVELELQAAGDRFAVAEAGQPAERGR